MPQWQQFGRMSNYSAQAVCGKIGDMVLFIVNGADYTPKDVGVCRGLDPEEPIQSSARLCCFRDLEVTVSLPSGLFITCIVTCNIPCNSIPHACLHVVEYTALLQPGSSAKATILPR